MSALRPECGTADPGTPCPRGVTAYLSIYNSVKGEEFGLIHGHLHDRFGHHCAVGCYFENTKAALPHEVVDEIATINDSCPSFTPKQRKNVVIRWLRWKLEQLGYRMPGRRPKE
jgi:hypothetical protein